MIKTTKTISTAKPEIVKHSERSHALLSASGASRWLNCTPSARLEESQGTHETSSYAAEGTLAHELSELYIRHDLLGTVSDSAFDSRIEEIMSNELFSDEMLDMVPIYVDYCTGQFNEARSNEAYFGASILEIEQKLDLTEYVPYSFGTADCIVVSEGKLEIIDLKYGKGIPVYAEYNKQLMLYALGALSKYEMLYDIAMVKMTIVQPRLNNISSFEMPVSELMEWAITELKPKAKLAFAGEGEFKSGEWCRFCAVKNRCKELRNKQLELAKYEFRTENLMTDDEIADVLARIPQLIEWTSSIQEYALSLAVNNGRVWPGFKLVEGISRRKWLDEDTVANAIRERFPEASEDQIYNLKLRTISEIEKTFGKKTVNERLSDVIVKPQGRPTLVPNSDKRPALGVEDAIKDFS